MSLNKLHWAEATKRTPRHNVPENFHFSGTFAAVTESIYSFDFSLDFKSNCARNDLFITHNVGIHNIFYALACFQ